MGQSATTTAATAPAATPATVPSTAPATGPAAGPQAQVVAIGTVEAFWSADQYAKTSGYVSEVKADIGDAVKKGQVLAVIDAPEVEIEVTAAGATLSARQEMAKAAAAAVEQSRTALEVAKRQASGARSEQRLAEATLKRQEELFADKAATSQQMDEVRAKAEVARSAVEVTEAKIAAAEADLESARAAQAVAKANADVAAAGVRKAEAMAAYTRITAPFDGIVTRRAVSPGDLVQAATAARTNLLFTVQQTNTMRVFCDIPESSAAAVGVGDAAEVKLYGPAGHVVRGSVTRLASAVSPETRTTRVEIDLDNRDGKLRPGMYAQVTVTPGGGRVAATPVPVPSQRP
jgi:multidrug resistance efflux pump